MYSENWNEEKREQKGIGENVVEAANLLIGLENFGTGYKDIYTSERIRFRWCEIDRELVREYGIFAKLESPKKNVFFFVFAVYSTIVFRRKIENNDHDVKLWESAV